MRDFLSWPHQTGGRDVRFPACGGNDEINVEVGAAMGQWAVVVGWGDAWAWARQGVEG